MKISIRKEGDFWVGRQEDRKICSAGHFQTVANFMDWWVNVWQTGNRTAIETASATRPSAFPVTAP